MAEHILVKEFLKNHSLVESNIRSFNDFLENELIPYIDKTYPTTTYRTYVGHSFGGLAVVNTLFTRPHLFDNYVAIDPSLWWDDQVLLKKAKSKFEETEFKNKALYIGIANTLPDNADITSIESDTSKTTIHIRSIMDFVKIGDKYLPIGTTYRQHFNSKFN